LQIQAISAEHSIWIATAYFAPSPSEVEALNGAARDGVDVRILVPGKHTDAIPVQWAGQSYYQELLEAVAGLSLQRRVVVVLRYGLGYTPTAIGELLGIPAGTVNSRLARALEELRADYEVNDVDRA